jgi:hypothetical protein
MTADQAADLTPAPCLNACGRSVPAYRAARPCWPCQADALGPLPAPLLAPIGPPPGIPPVAWAVFAAPDAPARPPAAAAEPTRPHGVVSVRRAGQQLQFGGEA